MGLRTVPGGVQAPRDGRVAVPFLGQLEDEANEPGAVGVDDEVRDGLAAVVEVALGAVAVWRRAAAPHAELVGAALAGRDGQRLALAVV